MGSWIAVLLLVFFPVYCHAVNPYYNKEEAVVSKPPSAPPSINQRKIPMVPHCERYFVYEGKKFECDSNLGRDGERLRPIIQSVPSAVAELDAYQRNLDHIRYTAYAGTAGILMIGLGGLISRPPVEKRDGEDRAGGYLLFGGIILAANALIYGLSLVKANETHLGKAIYEYNAANPNQPIVLEFKTP